MSTILFYEPFYHFDCVIDKFITTEACPKVKRSTNKIVPRPFKPRMDLHEDSEKNLISITFELPGVKKEDVQLEIQDNLLTVSTETKALVELDGKGYAIRERRFGKFERLIKLPGGLKEEEIKASLVDGILTVTFPKNSSEQGSKKISVE